MFSFSHIYPADARRYQAANEHVALFNRALARFSQARQMATIEQIKCFILRRFSGLRSLTTLPRQWVRARHYGGLRSVSLERIVGTLGRANDFDHHFQPRHDNIRDRWVGVALARSQHIPLEPVKLIQVGECYFVEDGHHRISVAHALGETCIEAEVTVWDLCCTWLGETPIPVYTVSQAAEVMHTG